MRACLSFSSLVFALLACEAFVVYPSQRLYSSPLKLCSFGAFHPALCKSFKRTVTLRRRTLDSIQLQKKSSIGDVSESIVSRVFFSIFKAVRKVHDPVTYFVLLLLTGFRWKACFSSMVYWVPLLFCIKWYRARYVFKIPVWDRQPNWNNVITSKEQEKDLKAFTCKTCGSTLFIAKTREFFFEGNTGIGGLGCFTCGAKGKDNFVMDRDRILEDVADVDDYFDYERPLDFVSAAERRKSSHPSEVDEGAKEADPQGTDKAIPETEAGVESGESTFVQDTLDPGSSEGD